MTDGGSTRSAAASPGLLLNNADIRHLQQAASVPLTGVGVTESMVDCFHNGLRDRIGQGSEAIVHPQAVFAARDKARLAQVGEVPRNGGLGKAQAAMDVTDTDLASLQQ